MKVNERFSSTVTYDSVDNYYTAQYKGKYHPHGHHIRFTKIDSKEVLVWNTLISPTKPKPVEFHYGKPVIITYEKDGKNEAGEQVIKQVRLVTK